MDETQLKGLCYVSDNHTTSFFLLLRAQLKVNTFFYFSVTGEHLLCALMMRRKNIFFLFYLVVCGLVISNVGTQLADCLNENSLGWHAEGRSDNAINNG